MSESNGGAIIVGFLFNYMNTAGKNGVTDYSGSCDYKLRNKGYKLGAFYHFCLVKEKVSIFTFEPYVGLSTGFVLNKVNEINRPVRRVRPGSWIPEG